MVNATALVNFGNGTGLEIGDWTYSTYLRSAPNYLPLNNASTSYLQASYPALVALLPTQFKMFLTSNTTVTFPAAVQWYTVAYGGGVWVAGSYTTGDTARSTNNAATWSAGGANIGSSRGMAYGAGLFFSTSGGTSHSSSPDGVTWTTRTTPVSVTGVAFGGGIFAAVGSNAACSSTDGITWTTRTIPTGDWGAITYGGGLFVAIDRTGGAGVTTVVTSPDGINWTSRSLPNAVVCYSITYGNGIFLLIPSTSTTVYTSPDGITWTNRTSTNHGNSAYVTFGDGVFGAYASSTLYISTDGITWALTSASPFTGSGNIGYGTGGVFVAVNNANNVTNLRFIAAISTTNFYLPVVTPVTGTFTYIRAT